MTIPNPTIPAWEHLRLIMPEIWLIIGMCAVIMVPFIQRDNRKLPIAVTFATLVLALLATLSSMIGDSDGSLAQGVLFHGSLTIDPFSQFFKMLLLIFTLLVVGQWLLLGQKAVHDYDVPDMLCLLLGATLGMSLMASASSLLTIFIAMEAASLPSFALAGFRKRHRIGTEGSLKYVIFGAASSAIGVYGMSLIYGMTGTLSIQGVAAFAAGPTELMPHAGMSPLLAVGLTAMLAGVAFKLSAVPLHFWCPDVFQGAPFEVTTFLSVASKGAAVVLLARIVHAFGYAGEAMQVSFTGLATGIAILGAVTATWGNLVALHQTNIKRLLAYSSIAHAGYMIMAVCTLAVVTGTDGSTVVQAILFYLLVYVFMNMGAFTVAAMIAHRDGTEDIRDYAGLGTRSPLLTTLMGIFLLSLFGMPTLGGFLGKVYIGIAMLKLGPAGFVLIAVLLINTVISLYFYLRPVYYMVFQTSIRDRGVFIPRAAAVAMLLVCAVGLFWTGLDLGASDLIADYSTLLTEAPVAAMPDATPAPADANALIAPTPEEAATLLTAAGTP